MKRFFLCAISAIWLSLNSVAAPTVTNVITLQSVNGTTNGATMAVGAAVPADILFAQNLGLGNTNDAVYYAQMSLDNTNFTTYATFRHARTNAGIEIFSANPNPVVLYRRVVVVTTNATTVGVQEYIGD